MACGPHDRGAEQGLVVGWWGGLPGGKGPTDNYSVTSSSTASQDRLGAAAARPSGQCLAKSHQPHSEPVRGGNTRSSSAGSIGPALTDIKSKYPDRNDLIAILYDETKRNPQTVMPPFGRNRILTDKEINAIVDFLQTL